ncbi:MAG TPA: gephyrin-like molybdotransferase Glp [Burkholderiaceae bacterium]|nr:gephyrin-like molybdotransferase Glp [Burkholderiaceae bacterium]
MLSVEQALEKLLSAAQPVSDVEQVDTMQANGRVLATAVVSTIEVPPLDNSQMDGYAVRTADVPAVPTTLPVSQRIAAGQVGVALEPGTAARIFTGAPVPPGADAVIMQEKCEAVGDKVTLNERPPRGEAIRKAGIDIGRGDVVLKPGVRLRPQHSALAASIGAARLTVYRRLRVATFFTGDELVMPGEPLPRGSIYNSNRFMLRALLESLGCEVNDLGIVPDDLRSTRDALVSAAADADLIISSGGVSVGEEDHVKPAVQAEGSLDLWQIAMKPGKPLAFGRVRDVPFIGLPGNPVSSFVTFVLFARPFVLQRQGRVEPLRTIFVRADFDWRQSSRRREFMRARLNDKGGLDIFPNQNSSVLTSVTWADGLIDNPSEHLIHAGDIVRFLPFAELLS